MKAIILAAGRGSRMRDLTAERPKCLIKLKGKPLIEWQLDAIRAAGINDIAVVTGYKNEFFGSYNLTEFHNERWSETNMVTSLLCADTWLRKTPCLISYSDIIFETSAVISLISCPAPLAITYDPKWLSIWERRFEDPLIDAETFAINSAGEVTEIGNKTDNWKEIQGQFMGLLRLTPDSWRKIMSALEQLPKSRRDQIDMTSTLQYLIKKSNYPIVGVPYEGSWFEFDSHTDLEIFDLISK